MKEVIFIRKNIDRWNKFELLIESKKAENPDTLASMFIQITDDLAYSRTFYPSSDTTKYLNHLASKTYLTIYKNKKEDKNIIKKFWAYDFPLILYQSQKFIRISFIIFLLAALVGAFSAANDNDFTRLILGDEYVDMTIRNIENGDPMAVYKDMGEFEMFVYIAFNNVRVSFYAFMLGLLASLGTIYILISNGIMVGAFQYMFHEYDVLGESAMTIWIHGTLEIFVIIVAGAAGLMLGSSMLYPKTYSRLYSFKQGVVKGIKYIIGVFPIFLVAAFFEGFFTRHTEWPDFIRLGIILASLAFIVWYFFIYPTKLAIKLNQHRNDYWTILIQKILNRHV